MNLATKEEPLFLGHFALALAAKRVEPRLSLGLTFAAAQTLDLVWPVLVIGGVERLRIVPGLSQYATNSSDGSKEASTENPSPPDPPTTRSGSTHAHR